MKKINLALIQMPVTEDVSQNLAKAKTYVAKAAAMQADFVVLPEMFCCPYHSKAFIQNQEPVGGPIWQALQEMARKNHIYLIGGTMPESDQGKIYNTSFVFDREGNQIGRHRKTHLFDINIRGKQRFCESDTLTAGDDITVIDTEFGKIGVEICFDIRFQELTHLMALEGAKLIFIPAAFNMTTGPVHWDMHFRARSVDSQLFIAGCSPARDASAGYIAYGHSLVVSPWGDILQELDEKENILFQTIDLELVDDIRSQLPILSARRTDIYRLEKIQKGQS